MRVATTLGFLITCTLENTKTIYEIRNLHSQTQVTNLDKDVKSKLLEELKKNEERIVQRIVETAIKQLEIDVGKKADLTKAVKKLHTFLDKDGHVEFVLPPTEIDEKNEDGEATEEQEALTALHEQVPQTRLLFEEVKRIRHTPSENDNQEDDESEDGQEQD